jgi:diguanylate cyclase (GGDEF)-like protein
MEKNETPKILVVDDSENILKTLKRILSKEGYEIQTAADGGMAMEKVYSWLPDLVLLDVKMPVMNGIEVCRLIKSNQKYSFIFVIMLTMKTDVEDEVDGFESGADDYIPKPFHPKTLMARVKRGLNMVKEKQDAAFDPLTKLYNRRVFELFLQQEMAAARRYQRPLSLVIMDLDHFKKVNDVFGHQVGDRVLEDVARILRDATRNCDLPARWGGEEMAVLLPETDPNGAKRMAENLRQKIEEHLFPEAGKITASFGVASMSDGEPDLFSLADKALYQAKKTGRNKVVLAIEGSP